MTSENSTISGDRSAANHRNHSPSYHAELTCRHPLSKNSKVLSKTLSKFLLDPEVGWRRAPGRLPRQRLYKGPQRAYGLIPMPRIEQISDQHVYVAFDPDADIASTDFSIKFCFVDLDADGNAIGLEAVGPLADAITNSLATAFRKVVGSTPGILEAVLEVAC